MKELLLRTEKSFFKVILLGGLLVLAISFFVSEETQGDVLKDNHVTESLNASIKWLTFSTTKHVSERNLVIKENHVTKNDLKYGKIFIAVADLNNDGIDEIFSYIDIWNYCGQIGCPFNIYQRTKDGKLKSFLRESLSDGLPLFMKIEANIAQKFVGFSTEKTNGYSDIHFNDFMWKFNGTNYTYRK